MNTELKTIKKDVLIVGSGAAALSCAIHLRRKNVSNIAIITDNINGGTSRNTGSDKQTYYKLSDSTALPDSPYNMIKSYVQNGSCHEDIALIEAIGSTAAFYNLVSLGVPFPHNKYGGYIGYKTDHDENQRGISLGPYTSKEMYNFLRKEAELLDIEIYNKYDVVRLLKKENKAVGLIALDKNNFKNEFNLFLAKSIVFGVGGPANFYKDSVYPKVHTGSIGLAMEIGAEAVNLTESQFGIGSVKFRWNLSGSYQQVVPCYYSTDKDGNDKKEFLNDYFSSWQALTKAIFLKGYQWPFDAKKIKDQGSSLIDLLVFNETKKKNRRVFLDFRKNPKGKKEWGEIVFDSLAQDYISKSNSMADSPIERLKKMNHLAIDLYRKNNIDLENEPLEIAICAQHNNGGLSGSIWWESTNISNLYPIGEVNGSHGVSRPGGSALNSGQVGALRAASKIAYDLDNIKYVEPSEIQNDIDSFLLEVNSIIGEEDNIDEIKNDMQTTMSYIAGPIRDLRKFSSSLKEYTLKAKKENIASALKLRHMLIAQKLYLSAIEEYLKKDGGSRGSYLVSSKKGKIVHPLLDEYKLLEENILLRNFIQYTSLCDGEIKNDFRKCRKLKEEEFWFENVWLDYREKKYFKE